MSTGYMYGDFDGTVVQLVKNLDGHVQHRWTAWCWLADDTVEFYAYGKTKADALAELVRIMGRHIVASSD